MDCQREGGENCLKYLEIEKKRKEKFLKSRQARSSSGCLKKGEHPYKLWIAPLEFLKIFNLQILQKYCTTYQ